MRKVRTLLIGLLGVWIGWRARGSFAAAVSRDAQVSTGSRGTTRGWPARPAMGRSASDGIEKVRAVVELGRERGLDLLQQVLGRGHAA